MDAYAVCDQERKPKKYRYAKSTEPVEDGTQGEATAVCGVVEARVGGGVLSRVAASPTALRINTTYPAGGGWATTCSSTTSTPPTTRPGEVTATAICLK